jgi:hypothetical protein
MIKMTRGQWAQLLHWLECAYYEDGDYAEVNGLEAAIDLLQSLGSEEE